MLGLVTHVVAASPVLNIAALNPSNVDLSWREDTEVFHLQYTTNLVPPQTWFAVDTTTNFSYTVFSGDKNIFHVNMHPIGQTVLFRLSKVAP